VGCKGRYALATRCIVSHVHVGWLIWAGTRGHAQQKGSGATGRPPVCIGTCSEGMAALHSAGAKLTSSSARLATTAPTIVVAIVPTTARGQRRGVASALDVSTHRQRPWRAQWQHRLGQRQLLT
jgi:hypothetical protein